MRRIRGGSLIDVRHVSITYPYPIRRDRIARIMTQFHYMLRTGSTSAVWRSEDGVGFEPAGPMEISQNDPMSGVVSGEIVATPTNGGDELEISVDLTLSWMDILVPGVGAIVFWLALSRGSSAMGMGSYVAIVIGPILIHSLMRLRVKRAWQDWLEQGIDDANESARQRYRARHDRR